MKLPAKPSTRRRPHECGVPINVEMKEQLRNRSLPLTNAQRHVLKQMGVKVDKNATEKEAVMLVKRICGPETNYRVNPEGSKLFRKRRRDKPKGISARQHMTNVLMYREENGSKRASKELAKI